METIERAKIRLEHWITHNDQHQGEYEDFVRELEEMGKTESAEQVRKMITHNAKGTECLREALKFLE